MLIKDRAMTIANLENYVLTPRAHGKAVWAHKTKPVWIAEYHRADTHEVYFQTYRATADIPEGKKPWDVFNKRLGEEIHGFQTLAAAAKAGDAS